MVGREIVERRVAAAVATVADPEFPGVSVVELGLLESIRVGPLTARFGFRSCRRSPAAPCSR